MPKSSIASLKPYWLANCSTLRVVLQELSISSALRDLQGQLAGMNTMAVQGLIRALQKKGTQEMEALILIDR